MKTNSSSRPHRGTTGTRWTRKNIFFLVTASMLMFQYQNCAQPVNQAVNSGDPTYTPQPIAGGINTSPVSAVNGSHNKLFFANSSIELSAQSSALRPGGVCAQTDIVNWSLVETAVNAKVLLQGSETCDRGTFHVELAQMIQQLECEKPYSLSASLSSSLADSSAAQMSIIRHCGEVADGT